MDNNKKKSSNHFGQVDFNMSNVTTVWFFFLKNNEPFD